MDKGRFNKIANDKNPANVQGTTPLHEAAKEGKLEVVKYITDQIDEKNPISTDGFTPLHGAAMEVSI